LVLAGAVALAATGATIGALLSTTSTRTVPAKPQTLPLQASALNFVNARTKRVVERVGFGRPLAVGDGWLDVAAAGRFAWVVRGARQRLLRIDIATRKITRVVKLPWSPGARLLTALGSVWVTQDLGPGLLRVDERTGRISRRFTFNGQALGAGL